MTWINSAASATPVDFPEVVARRPLKNDALGEALASAFDIRASLPDEWISKILELDVPA